MYIKSLSLFILLSLTMLACTQGPDSPRGFSLPQGNIELGEMAFKKYQCLSCHSLDSYHDASLIKELENPIKLGGTSSVIKTYGQLVTAIINPSHKIANQSQLLENVTNSDGSSKMRIYNDVMTVSELTNIVTFLQPKYKVEPAHYTQYQRF